MEPEEIEDLKKDFSKLMSLIEDLELSFGEDIPEYYADQFKEIDDVATDVKSNIDAL